MATEVEYRAIWDPMWQPYDTVSECNLCGRRGTLTGGVDRYGYAISWVDCECGLTYLSPRMTAKAYEEFYASGAYRRLVSAFWGRGINAKTLQPEQRAYAEEWGAWLEPYILPQHRSLLDIGGSTGVVAHSLGKRFGLAATVIDQATDELAEALKHGCAIAKMPAESLGDAGLTFDVVTLCQAIDHLLDPMKVLRAIRKSLNPGGRFFVDIVDYAITRELKIDHPFNFTEPVAKRYLAEVGFDVMDWSRANDGKHVGFICR